MKHYFFSSVPSFTISACVTIHTPSSLFPSKHITPACTAALAIVLASWPQKFVSAGLILRSAPAKPRTTASTGRLSGRDPKIMPGRKITVCLNPSSLTRSSSSPFIFKYGKLPLAFAPPEDISTYVSTPASLAALASSRFRSTSILRCASTLPAALRVVPSAEKKTRGCSSRGNWEAQVEVSVDVRGKSFGEAVGLGTSRRA